MDTKKFVGQPISVHQLNPGILEDFAGNQYILRKDNQYVLDDRDTIRTFEPIYYNCDNQPSMIQEIEEA